MAISVTQNYDCVLSTGRNPTADRYYTVRGTSDEVEARTALALYAPAAIDPYGAGLVLIPRETVTVEAISDVIWRGVVRYGFTAPDTDEPSETFDTAGGQQHITQSLQTVGAYKLDGDPNDPPAYGGAIGVNANGDVEGVDKIVPVYQFEHTLYRNDNEVTQAYKGALFRLTGRVNDAPFLGFAAGECLFLGASGHRRGVGKWEITFRFAASPNIDGTPEAPGIIIEGIKVTSKKGWEYLWIQYIDVEDANAKKLGKKAIGVYVEKIYDDGDFAGLGIGA